MFGEGFSSRDSFNKIIKNTRFFDDAYLKAKAVPCIIVIIGSVYQDIANESRAFAEPKAAFKCIILSSLEILEVKRKKTGDGCLITGA